MGSSHTGTTPCLFLFQHSRRIRVHMSFGSPTTHFPYSHLPPPSLIFLAFRALHNSNLTQPETTPPRKELHTLMQHLLSIANCLPRLMYSNCIQFDISATSSFSPWSAGLILLHVGDSSSSKRRSTATVATAARTAAENQALLHHPVPFQAWDRNRSPLTI